MIRNHKIIFIALLLCMLLGFSTLSMLSASEEDSTKNTGGFQFLPVWYPGNASIFAPKWWKGTYGLGYEQYNIHILGADITFFSAGYSFSLGGVTIPVGPTLQSGTLEKDGIYHALYTDCSFTINKGLYLRGKINGMLGKYPEYSFAEATAGILWNGEDTLNSFKQQGAEISGNITTGISGETLYGRGNGRISYYFPVIFNDLVVCPTVWVDGTFGAQVPLTRTPVFSLLPRTKVNDPLVPYSRVGKFSDFSGITNLSLKKKLFTLFKQKIYKTDSEGVVTGEYTIQNDLWLSLSSFAGFTLPPGSNSHGVQFEHGYGISVIGISTTGKNSSYGISLSLFFNESLFYDSANIALMGNLSTHPFKVSTWM